jgi:outer membrane receptor protein involved in Fe transport
VSVLARIREDRWRNYDAFQAQASGVTGYPALTRTAASPSLGFTWKALSPLSLHASAYEAFRAPSLNELYRPFRLGNVMTLANPALTAERFRGFQAGADVTLSSSALLRGTYFDGRVANSISTVTLSSTPTLITRQRQNLGRVRPRGEEFSAKVRATTWLTLWTDYTHLRSAVESAATASLVGKVVALVPSNNASARAIADWRRWNISSTERFGGAQFEDDLNTAVLPAFWTTDVFVSRDMAGDWLHGVHMLSPYVAVENLWNRRYAVALTPTPTLNSPRAVTAGVRLQLGRD